MNDDFDRMVSTRYKNERGFVTSIELSKGNSDFIKEKFGNRTQWIQDQHDQIIAKYRQMHGIVDAFTGYPRAKIHDRIHAIVHGERFGDVEL